MKSLTPAGPLGKITRWHILNMLLLSFVVVESLSLIEWASYPYFPDKTLIFARIDALVFNGLSPFSTILLLLLLYYWIAKLAASTHNRVSKWIKDHLKSVIFLLNRWEPSNSADPNDNSIIMSRPRLLLLIAVLAGVLLALVPYRLNLNPTTAPVGVDAGLYINWINQMLQRPLPAALSYAMGIGSQGSRPLLLIPLYLVVSTGAVTVKNAIESLPAILGPLLALSIFFFVRQGEQTERMAGLAAVLSVFSFYATVGIWAGFYANWLALSEAFLFLGVLLNFSKSASRLKFIILTLISLGVLLTHPWAWIIILSVSTLFAVLQWRDIRKTSLLKPIIVILAVNIIFDIAKSQLFGGFVAAQDASTTLSQSGVPQTLGFWQNLVSGLFFAYDGILANSIILGFSLIAIFYLRYRHPFERLLALWVALSSLPFIFLSSLLQTRILYNLPIPILETVGVLMLTSKVRKTATSTLVILLIILLSANYAIRTATTLVAVPF